MLCVCSSLDHDLALQQNVHSKINASTAMCVITKTGLWLPMHISMSCEQNTCCMQHEHAAAVLDVSPLWPAECCHTLLPECCSAE